MTGTPPRTLGARRLSAPPSCDEAAQAVAVVAATWTASYRSPSPLWSGEAAPQASPAAVAPARNMVSQPPPFAATPAGAVAGEVHADGAAAAGDSLSLDIGAELGLATATTGGAAPFLSAEVAVRRRANSARLLAMAVGARTIELGSGQAAWRRLMAGAGVARAWGTSAAYLAIGGDVVAGATFIEGSGFAQNATTTSFDVGAGPWVRAAGRLAAVPLTVWVGAQGLAWAREQRVRVDGVVSSGNLPRLDLLVGAGLTWTPPVSNRPRP
jgi:hypothetical protein